MALIEQLASIFLLILGLHIPNIALARALRDTAMGERHEQWMSQYGRVYSDANEKERRFEIFKKHVEFIESFNLQANINSYKLAVNEFADLTNKEFIASRNGYNPTKLQTEKPSSFMYENVIVPASIDWRRKGVVTPIKDQAQCGCCWAFSAVAAVEGIHMLKTGKLISLSEQELVDCDTYGVDQGCEGGLMDDAYDYIKRNGGITTEANYPYNATDGSCNTKAASNHAATITGHEDVPANDEKALQKAVAFQPVSVAIDASGMAFQFYAGGVFKGPCGTDLDHGVTIVGYGSTKDGTKYWLVKNSWGTKWG